MLNIVIPMAGRGSRFANVGYSDPKPFIDVGTKKMIQVVANNLVPKCEHRFIFICQKAHLQKYDLEGLLQQVTPNFKIIALDGITAGAASTVLYAKEYINNANPLMIANSDQWVNVDINRYLQAINENEFDGLIMTMRADDPKWSYVKMNDNIVRNVVEKVVVSDEATVGIYNFKHGSDFVIHAEKMITANNTVGGEYYVAPTYNTLIDEGAKIGVYNIGSERDGMYGLGIPEDLEFFLQSNVFVTATDF